ncbi:MAG: efflux RND transporter periplasmic adaptor subunit [Gammaproteobacteria bacterium]|nr:efflux RND transporter periplasmic adaptor subunit [Gammaproteobacteria bacterium]NNF61958.1 efflux RND transporter periplasmic adaptor subunit [Gammaproteobacteria bacterium]NNM21858.1 efflux RND transporter periplasmic adaptor subunit [Gammaproteobacteria bacterium]
MSTTRLLRFIGLLAAVTFITACKIGGEGEKTAEEDEEATPIPVETRLVERGEITAVYSGTAALEVDAEADVSAKVAGEIVELLVEEGDQVESGQVLARLDGERLRLEVARQLANVRRLEQDYRRNIELNSKGLVSAGAFEGMKYELESLRAALRLARLELGYTEIKAPFSGVIAERYVKRGNTITVNQPLFKITDLDPLLAYLHVPEKEFNKIKAGQQAAVQIDARPDQLYPARIIRISPVVDAGTGTFKVTVEIDSGDGELKPGMFGRISVVYDTRQNSMLVPRAALVDTDAETAVFVVEDGVARRREVTLGYANGASVEVTDGLSGDEQVVVIGQNSLKDGGKVRVIGAEPPDTRTAVEETPQTDPAS